MYMGFLKMGASIMTLFFLIAFVSSSLGLGILFFADLTVWFYSFFHVHNLASLPDEEFYAIEDAWLFQSCAPAFSEKDFLKKNNRIIAWGLIILGAIMTWQGVLHLIEQYLPQEIYRCIWRFSYQMPKIVVGIAIIVLGAAMIRGKKKELETKASEEDGYGEQ